MSGSQSQSALGASNKVAMTALCGFIGVASVTLMNRARHRPRMFQPWLHALLGGTGAYLGSRLGATYDDTRSLMERQAAGYTSLPTWAYAHLSKEELDSELRDQRLAEAARKFNELAALEEKEYLEARQAGGSTGGVPTRLV